MKVIILDDDQAVGNVMTQFALHCGYEAEHFTNDVQARSLIEELQKAGELLIAICDVQMPNVDTHAFCRWLNEKKVPYNRMTGAGDIEIPEDAKGYGAILQKPVGIAQVEIALEALANEASRMAGNGD